MRLANFLCFSLAAGATIRSPNASPHDGSRVYRVKAGRQIASVHKRLEGIASDFWNQAHGNLDVVIPRDQIEAFEAMRLNTRVLHADLGDSITKESAVKRKNWKRQANDTRDPWFDSYHPYADVGCSIDLVRPALISYLHSTSSGGMNCKVRSRTSQIGLALGRPTKAAISSACISGGQAVQASLL
jgi:hypothetical protein